MSIDSIGLPPDLVVALKHAASLPNPEFYEKERNRFWTGNTPRLIRCYREELGLLHLPRRLRAHAEAIAAEAGTLLETIDRFPDLEKVVFELAVELRPDQANAVKELASHALGILVLHQAPARPSWPVR